jgi:hypothetical protein
MLQASANACEPNATARPASVAPGDLALQVRGPDYETLVQRAQAARAAAITALIGQMVMAGAARLERLREWVASAIGTRAVSSQP